MLISYAQNFEDIMLWRALGHVKNGTYIDVGASDPIIDSVTKVFYDNGWSGINIEPVKDSWKKLVESRPRDVNMQCMAGDCEQEILIHEISGTGLSTGSLEIANTHEVNGYKYNTVTCKMNTLSNILQLSNITDIHFLKIDVEGFEKQVLLGLNLSIYRPWIIVVESIAPLQQQYTYHNWEHLIVDNHYKKVYCDGINNFYIANEHEMLCEYFQVPPNVFDKFWLWQNHQLIEPNANVQHLKLVISAQEQLVSTHLARAEHAEHHIKTIEGTFSWRITAPLRSARTKVPRVNQALRFSRDVPKRVMTAAIYQPVRLLTLFLRAHPTLFRIANSLLARNPAFRNRVIRIARLANLRTEAKLNNKKTNIQMKSNYYENPLLSVLLKEDTNIRKNRA